MAPALTRRLGRDLLTLVALVGGIVATLFTANGTYAYLAAAVTALMHAWTAAGRSRTGAVEPRWRRPSSPPAPASRWPASELTAGVLAVHAGHRRCGPG